MKGLLGILLLWGGCLSAVTVRPDFSNATLPPNIAPLNFDVMDATGRVQTTLLATSGDKLEFSGEEVRWPRRGWHEFLARHAGESVVLQVQEGTVPVYTSTNAISRDPIDAYLTYRLIPPGYSGFGAIGIWQRHLESFSERPVYRNLQKSSTQCVNCHTYNQADPDTYLFHTRLEGTGTRFVSRKHGKSFRAITTPSGMKPTYPAWHPSGDWVVFSANETFQVFYETGRDKIEVADLRGELMLYSLADGAVQMIEDRRNRLECFPAWDPAGQRLFTCCARVGESGPGYKDGVDETFHSLTNVCYDLVVRTFDPATRAFSEPQILLDGPANQVSVTFPRVSPDGRWLVMTVGRRGMFHVWHGEADLWLVDLRANTVRPLTELNSPASESYHCFSSNGRWMVFSSRRGDGTYTRPYLAHFDPATGVFSTPFLLPFEKPADDDNLMKSFNVPEFSTGPVKESPRELRDLKAWRGVKHQ